MALSGSLQKRLRRVLLYFGQNYVYKRGSNTITVNAQGRVMRSADRYSYFTKAESDLWILPAYVLTIAGDFAPFGTSPAATDTVTINGQDYMVKKTDRRRVGSVVVSTVLFVAIVA